MVIAIIAAIAMGVFGGFFPSFRAARTPITAALRDALSALSGRGPRLKCAWLWAPGFWRRVGSHWLAPKAQSQAPKASSS